MEYLITIHFIVNFIILYFYLLSNQSSLKVIYKEVLLTVFIGWVLLLPTYDD